MLALIGVFVVFAHNKYIYKNSGNYELYAHPLLIFAKVVLQNEIFI